MASEDTCLTPVLSVTEAFADNDAQIRGVIGSVEAPDGSAITGVRVVSWLGGSDPSGAPALGADSEAVRLAAHSREWPARGAR
jgi:crotonobetainyl-CoA:carnitine CoA-transferase CaiB-like acyl-CoA transferase